jgi:hypothetical protein
MQARFDAQDDATCRGYGAQKGADIYAQCRMQLSTNRQAAAAQGDAAAAQAGAAMTAARNLIWFGLTV